MLGEILSKQIMNLPASCLLQAGEAIVHVLKKWSHLQKYDEFMEAVYNLVEIVMGKLKDPNSGNLAKVTVSKKYININLYFACSAYTLF